MNELRGQIAPRTARTPQAKHAPVWPVLEAEPQTLKLDAEQSAALDAKLDELEARARSYPHCPACGLNVPPKKDLR
jgi:hypothetical protein